VKKYDCGVKRDDGLLWATCGSVYRRRTFINVRLHILYASMCSLLDAISAAVMVLENGGASF
jgi:hypothetical protein